MLMTNSIKLWPRVAVLLSAMHVLTSCQTMGIKENDNAKWYCSSFLPISWSMNDTRETIVEIKAHNAAWVALCDNKLVFEH